MTEAVVKAATMDDAVAIARKPRFADKMELWAMARMTPYEGLKRGLQKSDFAYTGFVQGVPICMWGVAPSAPLGRMGTPWMIGSWELDRHAKTFVKECRKYIDEMFRDYELLRNFVDVRNVKSINWLRWMGFEIGDIKPIGPDRLPFHEFEMRRP